MMSKLQQQDEKGMTPAQHAETSGSLRLLTLSLCFAFASAGCAREVQKLTVSDSTHQRTTICLGRYLLDLPGHVELGAATSTYIYRGGHVYNFQGFDGSGARDGLMYNRQLFTETHPVSLEWRDDPEENPSFAVIRGAAKTKFDAILKEQISRGDKQGAMLTGPIEVDFSNSYAFNSGGIIDAGFYFGTDRRARMLSIDIEDLGGAFNQATTMVADLFSRYRPRVATDIPAEAGVCTPYGFFTDPPGHTEPDYRIAVPMRSTEYPNLLFVLTIHPRGPRDPKSTDEVPNPNEIRVKDINAAVLSALSGVKRSFGPEKVQFAGQTGRLIGREYNEHAEGGGAAYELEAMVVGEPGSHEKPAITLSMAAALPFVEPKQPHRDPFNNTIIPWEDPRPLLKGTSPPPFEVGMKVFHQVLDSLRPRPGATANTKTK
jgi:hypothetical protein